MILAGGELYGSDQQKQILDGLEDSINRTCLSGRLDTEAVVSALDAIAGEMEQGSFNDLIEDPELLDSVLFAARMLRRETITYKLTTELGELTNAEPPSGFEHLVSIREPLGTLLHIAAGNMDALPAFSVIEGLLTGNINLLKLPQADSGLTIRFFQELLRIEPALTEYIYVFDTPSSDVAGMQQLASCSDGIVVWGGDAAVSAVRRLASPGCKLIEWGHRLSFCYISGYSDRDAELSELAEHIIHTRQLLCSSCQVIYLDTEDMDEVNHFCDQFLPFLENAYAHSALSADIGAAAEQTLRRYTADLDKLISGEADPERRIWQGRGCSLTACTDNALELSDMFGNVLVKPLPRRELLPVLRRAKGYLQTAGLICKEERREELVRLLISSGVNRILPPGKMSGTFPGESHDGEYPLQRYTRIVNVL